MKVFVLNACPARQWHDCHFDRLRSVGLNVLQDVCNGKLGNYAGFEIVKAPSHSFLPSYFSFFFCVVVRFVPSQADAVVFAALSGAPDSALVHALRWFNQINSYTASQQSR